MRLIPMCLLLTLAACGGGVDLSTLTPQERQDFLQCRYESTAATANMREVGLGIEKAATQNKLLKECLMARGYS